MKISRNNLLAKIKYTISSKIYNILALYVIIRSIRYDYAPIDMIQHNVYYQSYSQLPHTH